mmetsp:Transcript_1419/g.3315  ORF Transcript_1419/g.3315 Transcript_1419/m.3315 type:complete len:220 (-) Transcript_1419:915-1574(-)
MFVEIEHQVVHRPRLDPNVLVPWLVVSIVVHGNVRDARCSCDEVQARHPCLLRKKIGEVVLPIQHVLGQLLKLCCSDVAGKRLLVFLEDLLVEILQLILLFLKVIARLAQICIRSGVVTNIGLAFEAGQKVLSDVGAPVLQGHVCSVHRGLQVRLGGSVARCHVVDGPEARPGIESSLQQIRKRNSRHLLILRIEIDGVNGTLLRAVGVVPQQMQCVHG